MALMKRLGPALRYWRTIASVKTLNPAPSLSHCPRFTPLVYHGAYDEYKQANKSEGSRPKWLRELAFHTNLAGLFGFKFLETTHADSDEGASSAPPPPESPPMSSHHHPEEIAKREKLRLVELLRSKGGQDGSYPRFTVYVKGEKVTFRFQVPPSCEIPLLITNLVSRLGVKENGVVGSDDSASLGQIDGFEQEKEEVVAATNRKQDLDPALLSRFDSMIAFGLPDHQTRQEIAAQYAKHLTKSDWAELASATAEMSGRNIRDVCQQAERHWASKIIRAQKDEHDNSLPPLEECIRSALKRQAALSGASTHSRNQHSPLSKKPQFDFL